MPAAVPCELARSKPWPREMSGVRRATRYSEGRRVYADVDVW
jgi:hypothetical protein